MQLVTLSYIASVKAFFFAGRFIRRVRIGPSSEMIKSLITRPLVLVSTRWQFKRTELPICGCSPKHQFCHCGHRLGVGDDFLCEVQCRCNQFRCGSPKSRGTLCRPGRFVFAGQNA
jgi:hypothetical protein